MNRRILKKRCKRAMEILIREHGYKPKDFAPSNGHESVYAPGGMEKQRTRRRWDVEGFLNPGPLKGTPLLWERTSYEYDEWDAKLPTEVLAKIEMWASITPEDLAALGGWGAPSDLDTAHA
jgi:hypothetical protein